MCPAKGETPTSDQASGVSGKQFSFLPPPPFCPTWPKKNTLADRALSLFIAGRLIDHPAFQRVTKSWRLGAVVFDLRALGWPIQTIDVSSPTEENPHRIIARYHLPGKYVALAMAGGVS